jgi:hypothetical protein
MAEELLDLDPFLRSSGESSPRNAADRVISYGLTAKLLAEVLPTGRNINVAGIYRNLQQADERMEAELGKEKWKFINGCQRDWDALPPPGPPLTVGLDGGFIHAKDQKFRGEGWFKFITI